MTARLTKRLGTAASALLCYESERHSVRKALVRHGWDARQAESPLGSAPSGVPESGVTVLVIGQGTPGEQALLEAERVAAEDSILVLLLDGASEARQRWATQLTPFCYERSLAAESLACLLDRIRETVSAAAASTVEDTPLRQVTLRVGESVEIDGAVARLGVAERNLLWELCCRRGQRVGKDSAIEAGPGRRIQARECRRRLGRRLGDELATLLLPVERGEPYRLREPEEVRARCRDWPDLHPSTRLRIIGRSEVRLSFVEDLDLIHER